MTREELLALIDQAAEAGWKELDLAGQGLTELPPEIGKLTQLETLVLGKVEEWKWVDDQWVPILITNKLTILPKELAALKNLQTLNLSGNPLAKIPEFVFELSSLQSLILVSIDLSEIPEKLVKLTNLRKLDCSLNQLTQIPDVIRCLTHLTQLSFNLNQLTQIPEAIGELTNLTQLSFSRNQVTQIPSVLEQLRNLTQLDLSFNQLTQIPEVIGQLTNLEQLYLNHNQLTQISNNIGQLRNLIELQLTGNQLAQIPDSIGTLKNLTTLGLINNHITQIPDSIGQLVNLTKLYLNRNQLAQIPSSIGLLANLTDLCINRNQITEIPDSIGQLTNLKFLSLNSNRLVQIPDSIGKLKKLTELHLINNQLTQIPDVIKELKNLTVLELRGNKFTEIPAVMGHLIGLTQITLSNNQLTQIPDSIRHLKRLARLSFDGNQLTQIPDWLESLPRLTKLDLRRNPLPISPEILERANLHEEPGSVEGIFDYCRRLRSGEVRPLNEAKLLLVGQGGVGKTSLIERLLYDRYSPTQPQTDGLEVKAWNIHVNSKDVRLNVWDFGGQEIYHATHQFFLTKRSLYLLVCNCRTSEEENRIEYWLKLISSFGGDSPVIIVGNKRDEQPFDINRKALQEKYPNIKAILETSCQDNVGIEELRQAIIQEVAHLKEVYDLLPLSWFEVKEHLKNMDKDCIAYDQYIDICTTQAITTEADQKQLIGLLHNLGLVLNFDDHPILKSTNVLKPKWVTEGIYALLSDDTLRTENKGILTHADLSRILDPQRYPAHRHHYLTELMKEFELCFQLPDRSIPTFLIPGLLPKEEPIDTNLDGDTLEFQYHYPVLPDSIISRFIVLMHEKIYNQTYWRSGVMLAYSEGKELCNIARIKADPADAKIFISISGRETTRRSFLALIRDVFTRIHNSFGNLDVGEWVPVPNYPDHPPLDYQELLGLEEMGERDYPIGKLRIKVNIRQLLDGYESIESRQRKRLGDEGRDFYPPEYHIYGDYIGGDKVGNDKVGSDKIGRDKIQSQ